MNKAHKRLGVSNAGKAINEFIKTYIAVVYGCTSLTRRGFPSGMPCRFNREIESSRGTLCMLRLTERYNLLGSIIFGCYHRKF
jgi:hypothetical protein